MLNNDDLTGRVCDTGAFMDLLTRLFNKAAAIEREPVDTGDGVLLHTSEVHLLDMAGRYPQEGMSSLASRLGITKGAVSQTAKKLVEKGYLERVYGEGDCKTVLLRLTGAGQNAYLWHRQYHDLVNSLIAEEYCRLSPDDRQNILAVLGRLEAVFDACPENQQFITERLRAFK
jgi:DNA-binding MarR family transcriptional regulator